MFLDGKKVATLAMPRDKSDGHGNANLLLVLAIGTALGLKHGSHVDYNAAAVSPTATPSRSTSATARWAAGGGGIGPANLT